MWKEWPQATEWVSNNQCPECGYPLIITSIIGTTGESDIHNAICPECRKQYTTLTDAGTSIVNLPALRQQERLEALEQRVAVLEAQLEEILASLLPQKPREYPKLNHTPEDPETEELREKYSFLF